MKVDVLILLGWMLALSSGLMAGVYLAFSSFIIRSLASLGAGPAVVAMNAINTHILRSAFMPLFFGSTLIALMLVAAGLWRWGSVDATVAVVAGGIYALGMFGVTAALNVPLNNMLARVAGDGVEAEAAWSVYRSRWTRWNTVRTVASIVTLILCVWLIV